MDLMSEISQEWENLTLMSELSQEWENMDLVSEISQEWEQLLQQASEYFTDNH